MTHPNPPRPNPLPRPGSQFAGEHPDEPDVPSQPHPDEIGLVADWGEGFVVDWEPGRGVT